MYNYEPSTGGGDSVQKLGHWLAKTETRVESGLEMGGVLSHSGRVRVLRGRFKGWDRELMEMDLGALKFGFVIEP